MLIDCRVYASIDSMISGFDSCPNSWVVPGTVDRRRRTRPAESRLKIWGSCSGGSSRDALIGCLGQVAGALSDESGRSRGAADFHHAPKLVIHPFIDDSTDQNPLIFTSALTDEALPAYLDWITIQDSRQKANHFLHPTHCKPVSATKGRPPQSPLFHIPPPRFSGFHRSCKPLESAVNCHETILEQP